MKNTSPCHGCEDRCEGCHSKCYDRYLAWCEQNAKQKARIRTQKKSEADFVGFNVDNINKRNKEAKRSWKR